MIRAALMGVMGLLAWGCSSSDDASMKQPSPVVPQTFELSEVANVIAQAHCRAYRRCRLDLRERVIFYPDTCVDEVSRQFRHLLEPLQAGIERGGLQYNGEGFARCIAAIDDSSCADVDIEAFEVSCTETFIPQIPLGEPCSLDAECDNGYCPGDDGCQSVCSVLSKEGESCSSDGNRQCEADLDCDVIEICRSKEQAAALTGKGQFCLRTRCRAGLRCLPSPEPVCFDYESIYVLNKGEACPPLDAPLNSHRCQPPLRCTYASAKAMENGGVCTPPPKLGEPCQLSAVDRQNWCPTDSYCRGLDPANGVFEGVCTPHPKTGEACGQFYGFLTHCGPDHFCMEERCRALGAPGESCERAIHCRQGICRNSICTLECVDSAGAKKTSP